MIPLLTTALKPNGLALSPDEKTLYISDNGARRRALIAADRGAGGKVSNARVIHDFGTGRGIDGMTVTTDGRIVAASAFEGKPAVLVLSPDGKILASIAVPEDPPTSSSAATTARPSTSAPARACTGSRPR